MLEKIYHHMKKDIVLTISCILAVLSCIISPISVQYIDYIDIHTLILLFCLMLIVEGLRQLQFFSYIANILLLKVHTQRGLSICLVSLCFISSMFITNDVALITFIPFGIMILELVQMKQKLSFIITLMTIAANLGSMFTPIGNPQNMYLYSISSMHITSFLFMMLPYILIAAILLLGCIIFKIKKENIHIKMEEKIIFSKRDTLFYLVLFILCLLSVSNILSHPVLLIIISICIFMKNKRLFLQIDYALLLTFIFFFIFVGNLNQLTQLKDTLTTIVAGNETMVAILLSQIISNVPAAMLLSNYATSMQDLIIGTNIGGLGTLIASMASLISYKQIVNCYPDKTKQYIKQFTYYNLLFLLILFIFTR